MAKITIGLGFVHTATQESAWRDIARRLPDDWTVLMSGDPATHIFGVTVKRPDQEDIIKTFAPEGAGDVGEFLQSLLPPQ